MAGKDVTKMQAERNYLKNVWPSNIFNKTTCRYSFSHHREWHFSALYGDPRFTIFCIWRWCINYIFCLVQVTLFCYAEDVAMCTDNGLFELLTFCSQINVTAKEMFCRRCRSQNAFEIHGQWRLRLDDLWPSATLQFTPGFLLHHLA